MTTTEYDKYRERLKVLIQLKAELKGISFGQAFLEMKKEVKEIRKNQCDPQVRE